jgi:hypothetical protein
MEEILEASVTQSTGPTSETWELQWHRATIKRLYLDEDKTLPQVMAIMKRDHDLKATVKMYKRRLTLWRMDGKYLKRSEVKQIARKKIERDGECKSSRFYIKGREVKMEKIQRYLKKHGFLSLEDFEQAASPDTQSNHVVCTTPAQSPMSPAVDENRIESQEMTQTRYIGIIRCDASTSKEARTVEWDAMSLRRISGLRHFLSLSPQTRSRQLLSLSPILRTPTLPTALLLPEQMLSISSFYRKATFEAGTWETRANGYLYSKFNPHPVRQFKWTGDCHTAVGLIRQRKYVQSRQVVSHMCTKMELYIKLGNPDLLRSLLYVTRSLQVDDMHEISSIVTRHAYHVATTCLGSSHPVTRMCSMLMELGAIEDGLSARLLQHDVDRLEKELGRWHLTTMQTLRELMDVMDASEAVDRSRASLAECEIVYAKNDERWFRCMDMLARALFADKQAEDAEIIAWDLLNALDSGSPIPYAHSHKARVLHLLYQILHGKGDLLEAERCARRSVFEAVYANGWRDPETIRFMVDHVDILRWLGIEGQAEQVDAQIQDLLGPPEIIELLS